MIFHLLCDFSQRDDTGEIPQHSRETQEVAAACGQDVPGAGTELPSQHSSGDTYLTACRREAGGRTSRTDPLSCSWYSAPLRTSDSRRRVSLPEDQCGYSVSFQTSTTCSSDVGDDGGHAILKGQSPASSCPEVTGSPRILQLIWFCDGKVRGDSDWMGCCELYLISKKYL